MPIKEFPSDLLELLNRGNFIHSYPALDITFDDGSQLFISTTPITVDGVTYSDHLQTVRSIKTSLSRSVDRAELIIDNSDLLMGDEFDAAEEDAALDNAKAKLHWIYQNADDPTEKYRVPRMSGMLYTYTEEGETDLRVTLLSDDFAGGGVAPFEVRPTCVWKYKGGTHCDYSGDLPTCDFTFDGPDGCVVHFGTEMAKARYGGGAVELDVNQPIGLLDDVEGPIRGPGGCFIGGTPVFSDEAFNSAPIESFTAGKPVLGFDKRGGTAVRAFTRSGVYFVHATRWFELIFSDGSDLHVTDLHPFYPMADSRKVLARDLIEGSKFKRLMPTGKYRTVKLVRKIRRTSKIPVKFYNVPVAGTQSYHANGYAVSNNKPPLPPI